MNDNFYIGQKVVVTNDFGKEEVRTVRLLPWQLGHGAWVIGLSGIAGGYSLERVKPLEAAK